MVHDVVMMIEITVFPRIKCAKFYGFEKRKGLTAALGAMEIAQWGRVLAVYMDVWAPHAIMLLGEVKRGH